MWNPRVGGEKFVDESRFYKNLGSPPHGRGKVRLAPLIQLLVGITPAWAGKRTTRNSGRKSTRDHPRMGREKAMDAIRQQ